MSAPPRTVTVVARAPSVTLGTGTNVIGRFFIIIQDTAVSVTAAALTGITRYPWRIRREGATSDLRSGTATRRPYGSTVTGLTTSTSYTYYIRAQAGTTSSGTLYGETAISFQTLGPLSDSRGASGAVGASGRTHHTFALIDFGDPPDDFGNDYDTGTDLTTGDQWQKRDGKWHRTTIKDHPGV